MASQSEGIKQLLEAEKKASDMVAEARREKAQRLRTAHQEANDEIEKYRKDRENAFREYERQHMGSQGDIKSKIERETKEKLATMNERVQSAKEGVIEELLQRVVCHVQPKLHRNLRL